MDCAYEVLFSVCSVIERNLDGHDVLLLISRFCCAFGKSEMQHVTSTANASKRKMDRFLLLAVIVVVVILIPSVVFIVNNAYLLWLMLSPTVPFSRVLCSKSEAWHLP